MRRRALTRRGFGAVVFGAGLIAAGLLAGSQLAVLFGVLLLALLLCALIIVYLPYRRPQVEWSVSPQEVERGADTTVTLTISGRPGVISLVSDIDEALPSGLSLVERVPLVRAAKHTVRAVITVAAITRGDWMLDAAFVHLVDPFGLARRTIRVFAPSLVTVIPRAEHLDELALVGGGSAGERPNRAGAGLGHDDTIPRPYAQGDSMRRIHWRASARWGELMVREDEHDESPDALITLDCAAASWSLGSDFDFAVELTASVALHLAAHGYRVRVVDDRGEPFASLGADDRAASVGSIALLLALTPVAPRAREEHLAHAAARFDRAIGAHVVITGSPPTHHRSLLAVSDPQSTRILFVSEQNDDALADAAAGWRIATTSGAESVPAAWKRLQ